jgi:hypothetical protein
MSRALPRPSGCSRVGRVQQLGALWAFTGKTGILSRLVAWVWGDDELVLSVALPLWAGEQATGWLWISV